METGYNSWCLTRGIIQRNDPVPLKSVSVDVKIEGFIVNVQSTLVYKNVEKKPIEVRYEFPMDDQSVVYHFEAQIEDRIIIAECQEKKQAKETYDEAMKYGYGAVLLQEDDVSSDIFTCLVGNLPPDAEAVIKFGYVTELSLQPDGILTFLLPTLLNPRYNPSAESGGSRNPPNVSYILKRSKQPYKFEIQATVINPGKIGKIIAPKDNLDVKLSNDKTIAQINLTKPFTADHDFTLEITLEAVTKPHIIIERGNIARDGILKQDVVMLNFFPELKEADYTNKHEFIFVVDRSGSMQGSRMTMAKETLLLFLKSLPPGCYFNIVGFGSTFKLLFPDGSREYSKESLKIACDHQKTMDANLGGTEILQPLKNIYDKPPMARYNREILLLTDGQVSNTETVIELVKNNAKNTRLFSFGIGEGASTALVKGIARAGKGKSEFTKEGERLQPLVVKTMKAAMQLSVSDLSLDWQLEEGSTDIIQLPQELPPIFAGEKLILFGVTSQKDEFIGKVQLKGNIGERQLEFVLEIDSTKTVLATDQTLPIHRLAAKAQIKQLQDTGKDENKDLIVLLSTAANVISCHTSMVGIDKNRKEKIVDDLIRRNVPIMHDRTLGCGSVSSSLSLSNFCSTPVKSNHSSIMSRAVQKMGSNLSRTRKQYSRTPPMPMPLCRSSALPTIEDSYESYCCSDLRMRDHDTRTFNAPSSPPPPMPQARKSFALPVLGIFRRKSAKSETAGLPRHAGLPLCAIDCDLRYSLERSKAPLRPEPNYMYDDYEGVNYAQYCEDLDSHQMSTRQAAAQSRIAAGVSKGTRSVPVPKQDSTYMNIVALQSFSGKWKLNSEFADILNSTVDALKKLAPVKALDVWATALALSHLKVKFSDKRDEWEMVAMKARKWLDRQDRGGLTVDELLEKARSVVGQQ